MSGVPRKAAGLVPSTNNVIILYYLISRNTSCFICTVTVVTGISANKCFSPYKFWLESVISLDLQLNIFLPSATR